MKKYLLVGLFSLLLSGCVIIQNSVPGNTKLNHERSYIYGDFVVEHDSLSPYGYLEITLELVNIDTKETVYVGFSEYQTLQLLPIKPGNYVLEGIAYLNHLNFIQSEKPLPWGKVKFTARPGHGYFLGEYAGTTYWKKDLTWETYKYNVHKIELDPSSTNKKLLIEYTDAKSLKLENIIPNNQY